jgi:AraC-like DNA-binding protein
MLDELYLFSRGASGFALLAIGAGLLAEPGLPRVRRAFGTLFLALGTAFLLSRLSESWLLPIALDNLLVVGVVYAISQSMFEIGLYLFGDETVRGSRRAVYLVGAVWSLLLWLLPALDLVFDFPVLRLNMEDSRPMALFQSISSIGVYAWPIAITLASLRYGRWRLADWPHGPGAARAVFAGIAGAIGILVLIGVALILDSRALYRAAHSALEALMLTWYFYYQANPGIFLRARREIGQRHQQREKIDPAEAGRIAGRLKQAVEVDHLCANPRLSLQSLAKAIRIPSYRLSAYFNTVLGVSFPEWLNAARIERVKQLLDEYPERTILDIAMAVGYASKAVFNSQFQRRLGMSPSAYRRKKIGINRDKNGS